MEQELDNSNADDGDIAQNQPSEVEIRALETGWVPKDQFRGDPEKWRPAEEWVERTETLMPIMKATNRNLEKKLQETEAKLREQEETSKKFANFMKGVEERAVKQALEQLREQRKEAFRNGDAEAFEQAEAKMKEIETAASKKQPETVVQQPVEHPQFVEFKTENPWYSSDPAMRAYADTYAQYKYANLPKEKINPQDVFEDVQQEIRRRFPEKFGRPTQTQVAFQSVESGGMQSRSGSSRSYDRLTPTAKAECDKFVRQMGIKAEDYVKHAPPEAFR